MHKHPFLLMRAVIEIADRVHELRLHLHRLNLIGPVEREVDELHLLAAGAVGDVLLDEEVGDAE